MNTRTPIPASLWIVWFFCTLIGAGLIAIPDDGRRLFSFSRTHGPSALDGVGMALLIGGWLLLGLATVVRWRQLAQLERGRVVLGAVVYVIGAAILVPSIVLDLGLWWMAGALIMAAAQLAAAMAVSRR